MEDVLKLGYLNDMQPTQSLDFAHRMPKKIQNEKSTLLFPMNGGRAGHFYHYMLGYLMPIVISPDRKTGRVSVVSVGLLDRITRQVFGNEVDIIPEPDITKIDYPKARNRINKRFGNLYSSGFS